MATSKPTLLTRLMLKESFKDGYLDLMLSGLIILFGLNIFLSRTIASDLVSGILSLFVFLIFLYGVYRYHRSMQLNYVGMVKFQSSTKKYVMRYGWIALAILVFFISFSLIYLSFVDLGKYLFLLISEGFFLILFLGISWFLKQGRFIWIGLIYACVFQLAVYLDLHASSWIMPGILMVFGFLYASFSLLIWWKTLLHRNERG